jgi:hypothetical protein
MRIVFVHLGTSGSDHMWANIKYLSRLAPNFEIDVITSKDKEELLEKHLSPRVNHFQYISSDATEELLGSLEIDSKYRNGFWRYSLERLIALTEHHTNFPGEGLLHIESDVLLLNSFPFASFEPIQKIAWSTFEKDRDVASLIYLPNGDLSSWLLAQLLKFLRDKLATDDMHLLSLISKNFDQLVLSLPIAPTSESRAYSSLSNPSNYDRVRCAKYSENFAGVFDAAAIGIWLTGTHAVNGFGVSRRYDTNLIYETKSYVDPAKIDFQISHDGDLFWIEDGKSVNVHSLHIHSKNLDFFSPKSSQVIRECVSDSRKGKVTTHFSFVVLLGLIQDNWKRGTLLRYLSWLPGVRRVKVYWNNLRRVG